MEVSYKATRFSLRHSDRQVLDTNNRALSTAVAKEVAVHQWMSTVAEDAMLSHCKELHTYACNDVFDCRKARE